MKTSSSARSSRPRALLARTADVRLVELSPSGCLLETESRLDVATAGELRLSIVGGELGDDIRVSRCLRVEGSGSRYRAAAEFLCIRNTPVPSLRRAAQRFLDGDPDALGAKARRRAG